MKLKEDLIKKWYESEIIVENDSQEVVKRLIGAGNFDHGFYIYDPTRTHKYDAKDRLEMHRSFYILKPIIKASELIEKEDYTKPLEKGKLCVFFDDIGFIISFYKGHYENELFCQLDAQETIWKYAFTYEGQTQEEIQEKINSYLKDK